MHRLLHQTTALTAVGLEAKRSRVSNVDAFRRRPHFSEAPCTFLVTPRPKQALRSGVSNNRSPAAGGLRGGQVAQPTRAVGGDSGS